MHKIIKQFIETEKPLIEILNDDFQPDQPVEVAFKLIMNHFNRESMPNEIYKKIDLAIEKGHPDEELYILFISFLVVFYGYKNMLQKSRSAYVISCSFEINKYHAVVQSFYHQMHSNYFLKIKDFENKEKASLLSLAKMPKNLPRYKGFLANYANILGVDGRLNELSAEDLAIIENFAEYNYIAITGILCNAFYTIDIKTLDKYFKLLQKKFKNYVSFKEENLRAIIDFYNGSFENKSALHPIHNNYISYFRALKHKDIDTAKKIYGAIEIFPDSYFFAIFHFIHFHHAFITNRFDVIENIIKKENLQTEHYIYDFFIARYCLIKNDFDSARFYYARLLKNCEKYKAFGRLKFEMQFALELSASAFYELMQPMANGFSQLHRASLTNIKANLEDPSLELNNVVGHSKIVKDIKKKVEKFADVQRPIFIWGETGVGKEVIARAIHEKSKQKDQPFLAVNCGGLTDTLLQSELFGHEAGAFTGAATAHKGIFEAAEEGVVFMDEFGEMSSKLQVSLLRVLENNEVLRVGGNKVRKIKCRIIAATNANIEVLIQRKLFREDLYHRLKQFSIYIAPLRERKEDIPDLIDYFLNEQNENHQQSFSPELLKCFQEYHWPGNIRELKNEVDRIKLLCGFKPIIEVNDVEIDWLKKLLQTTINMNIFQSHNTMSMQVLVDEQIHQRLLNKKLTFAERRHLQIKELFRQYKKLTRAQIADALQVGLLTTTKDLQKLCAEGVIIKRMPSRSPQSHYFELRENQ